ncbi:DUF5644 domain-containing protein [Arcobacter sp. CECT 8985]|uniref:HdrB C-terminal domain-containing protein n=1 Tax=Arcobacter sp. CECT 8985 TaxID=1935424 RepID=UPI00100B4049|nr:DUF5644 domain-containing protein [Arcobacter sp. CECT 8985]RXJ83895.1 hypothetical protein CRU93_13130 [Arcobacter sp. CECT 8985]
MKLEISLFKFDYKSDYIPYYKKYLLNIKEERNLLDILNTINIQEEFQYEKDENTQVVINNLVIDCDTAIDEIKQNFGNELTIEPLSKRRAMTDLVINDDDFYDRLELFDAYINDDDKSYYKTLKKYYYASNTLNFEKNYIGDSSILFADYLINKYNKNKSNILNIIKSYPKGIEYHTSLNNRIFNIDHSIENKILNLKKELNLLKKESQQNFKVNKKTNIDLKNLSDLPTFIKNSFNNFNIAYYGENNKFIKDYLNKLDCKIIDLESKDFDLNKTSFHKNKELTFKIAGEIIQEAYDKGSDFIIVNDINDFFILDYNRKELKKQIKREIDLPVLHLHELNLLVEDKIEEASSLLKKHSINPKLV